MYKNGFVFFGPRALVIDDILVVPSNTASKGFVDGEIADDDDNLDCRA